ALATNTDFGISGYRGPCPPVGAEPHRYVVTVYALDVSTLPLAVTSSGAMASFMINSHLLAKTSITGYFGRYCETSVGSKRVERWRTRRTELREAWSYAAFPASMRRNSRRSLAPIAPRCVQPYR